MSCFSDGAAGQESACIAEDTGEVGDRLNSWVRKMPWRRRWQPAPVFLPGSFHGQRSMAGYSPNYHNKSDTTEWLNTQYWIIIQSTNKWTNQFSSVQSLSHVRLFATPWIAACQASLSITNSHSLLKLMSIKSVMPSSHLILCRPLLLLPPILPSIKVFSNESALRIRWPKHLEFQLQHQSFQWTPRTDLLQDGMVGSPCSPRDSQESSPTPQFKSSNSLALSFLHYAILTSIHDHWKNHSLD